MKLTPISFTPYFHFFNLSNSKPTAFFFFPPNKYNFLLLLKFLSSNSNQFNNMSTTWTTTPSSRIIRWRVRDWVSCFLASRIPLDHDDPESNFHASAPQIRNMVREFNGGGGTRCQYHHHHQHHHHHHHNKRRNRRRKDRRVEEDIISNGNEVIVADKSLSDEGEATNSDSVNNGMPLKQLKEPTETASVEDYIVFCFGENGAFEVVKDYCRNRSRHRSTTTAHDDHTKSSAATKSCSSATKHSATKKLNYENQGIGCGHESCKKRSSSTDGEAVGSDLEAEGEENSDRGSTNEIRNPLEEMDGNQSDDSSSDSFSFPVLQWEEMVGSPIQMPKPQDFHLRKQRLNCARFQCCRF
ncbi:Protein BREAKING OF ASYMMETRY IN THE STOMATAL LINEAGE [Linum grandiflorum]